MKREGKDLDRIVDQAIAAIRDEELDSKVADEAAARVWKRIQQVSATRKAGATVGPIQNCPDYQKLLPAYIANGLSEARAMLLEDHVRECVPCRKALKQARAGKAASASRTTVPRSARRRLLSREWSWAVAAAVIVAVALIGLEVDIPGVLSIKTGGIVTIKQVDGSLFHVTEAGTIPISAGDTLQFDPGNDGIRTAKGSRAILELSDGSQVEMNERSQLSVLEQRSRFGGEKKNSTIELDRGGVIVEAADQGNGKLHVETAECTVEVTGTVFSVNHGIKGSRVSVFEGEVRVDSASRQNVLQRGDQVVTSPNVDRVPLEREIAWSQNVDRHLALLSELTKLGKELDEVMAARLRYSTRLLDRTPADTVVYAAIPNISGALSDAYRHVRKKVDTNPVLREWWERSVVPSGADAELGKAIDKIRDYGEHFGEEIVFTMQTDGSNEIQEPLILAELKRPAEFREMIVKELLELNASTGHAPNMVVLEGATPEAALATRPDSTEDFYIWIHEGFFAASPERERIHMLAANVAEGSSTFTGTAFHGRLADRYQEGVEWVLGVDLNRIIEMDSGSAADRGSLEKMGLLDIQHLIVQRRDVDGKTDTRAVLSFDQARRGLVSWLAAPAPMGTLDFVSPDATLAAAFVMKTPSSLVEELLSYIGSSDADFTRKLAEFEQEHEVDIRGDFAAPLGGEFAFALDGPVLPKPSWKFVMEVYDPAQLQRSFEWTVARLNELAAERDKQGFEVDSEKSGGRTFYAIRSLDTGIAVHYMFVDGYMVAAPSRLLLDRALDFRKARLTLPRSHRFKELLPRDGQLNFSAVAYQNLGSVLGPVARRLENLAENLDADQLQMIEAIGRDTSASLAYAYGKRDQIVVAASSQGGFFSSGLTLFSLQSLLDMQRSIGQAVQQQASDPDQEAGI